MRIAVAGGTGTVGRHVVRAASEAGHEPAVLARSLGINVVTGQGIGGALAGADVVVDATNLFTLSGTKARRFFLSGTRTLMDAGARVGVQHYVALSIVGIDAINTSYYGAKLGQERSVAAGSIPHTIARAAQFHEFSAQLLGLQRGPIAAIPKVLMRPVSAREIGDRLVRLAEQGPAGRVQDLVGPHDETAADLARRQLKFDGSRRKVIEVRLPGVYGKGLASGLLRGTPDALQGTITFDEWLASEDHLPR
ncbi:SDR family oxidoreductase [Gulosibacter sediminis]|uniref:SDR family oxidoreductase n=1 Tax=Gulosibacter sediminis TaxID=1729695 RepID=UPI001867DC9D|nr:NmrA family NAD(P)-binding protein [Gulosibacter sediminis]